MITSIVYANIVCLLEQADSLQLDAVTELSAMQDNLIYTITTDARRALLDEEIERIKVKIVDERSRPYVPLVEAIKHLQMHVTKYYGSVNAFLSDNNLQVSPFFATLSNSAGYVIDGGNIGSSCLE